MKVFKFFVGEYFYAVAAKTVELAKEYLFEYSGEMDIRFLKYLNQSGMKKISRFTKTMIVKKSIFMCL